ncbi:MAG: undecaprenyl-diphosphate phosphatase [Bacteroidales bacterium]
MSCIEAIILGIVQGLTEFLPVSSSGHLAIGGYIFGMEGDENLSFAVAVHAATVLSTIVILRKEIMNIIMGLLQFKWNEETKYALKIFISMIPIGIVGLFFKDYVESIFGSGLLIVGIMLLITALLLAFSYYAKPRVKESMTYRDAFIIGLAQACAVMPGLSRSGSTIATGLLLGNKKESVAKFSFLMVVAPILGEAALDLMKGGFSLESSGISPLALASGFMAAFITGAIACKMMINIVNRGKLIYFSYYCVAAGVAAIIFSLI